MTFKGLFQPTLFYDSVIMNTSTCCQMAQLSRWLQQQGLWLRSYLCHKNKHQLTHQATCKLISEQASRELSLGLGSVMPGIIQYCCLPLHPVMDDHLGVSSALPFTVLQSCPDVSTRARHNAGLYFLPQFSRGQFGLVNQLTHRLVTISKCIFIQSSA